MLQDKKTYDYIIVGGGSAGCALAARLAEKSNLRILLIEAGRKRKHIKFKLPILTPFAIADEASVRNFSTQDEIFIGNRKIHWPRGMGIGGSTLINGMLWVKGDPSEYDAWSESGCLGWSYKELSSFFRAAEKFNETSALSRGKNGAFNVERYKGSDVLTMAFVDGLNNLGYKKNSDYNGECFEGVSILQFNTKNGLRHSADVAYLKSLKRNNLTIRENSIVHRINIKDKKALGVEYVSDGVIISSFATRETIICAGSIQTPQILQLSGIGNSSYLQSLGINPVHNLIGVGSNLIDHFNFRFGYETHYEMTLNNVQNSIIGKFKAGLRWGWDRSGPLSIIGATSHAILKSNNISKRLDTKIQLLHYSANPFSGNLSKSLDNFSGFSISSFPLRPSSRGTIRIASKDPMSNPIINANYLSHQDDIQISLDSARIIGKLEDSENMKKLIKKNCQPKISTMSDEELINYIKAVGQTSYHPIGTCKMGTDEQSVVNPQLQVYGIENLRIADASIMPTMPSSNTQAPSSMIGEKLASIILNQ